jgi:GNAT superfamily N-acetyltransferase
MSCSVSGFTRLPSLLQIAGRRGNRNRITAATRCRTGSAGCRRSPGSAGAEVARSPPAGSHRPTEGGVKTARDGAASVAAPRPKPRDVAIVLVMGEEQTASLRIRRATTADARGIARVHVRAWRESYTHVFSSYLLEGLSVSGRADRWTRILARGTEVWVAETDGRIVGWASAGQSREPDAPVPLELQGIYVLRDHYGTGAGQRLLDAALGDSPAFLWVLGDNPRAQAFYRRNGFTPDGTSKVGVFGGEPAHEVRMVRGV